MEGTADYQIMRLDILTKTLESVQKELSTKLNIKDIIPLVRQNILVEM